MPHQSAPCGAAGRTTKGTDVFLGIFYLLLGLGTFVTSLVVRNVPMAVGGAVLVFVGWLFIEQALRNRLAQATYERITRTLGGV